MTDREMLALVSKIIEETVKETGGGPESMLYLPFAERGMELGVFKLLLASLEADGRVKIQNHWVSPAK